MGKTEREELEKACRKERDSRVVPVMLAVHMVCVRQMSIGETAANLMRSERRVHKRTGHPRTAQRPSKSCYGRTKTSRLSTFRKDPRTSTRLRKCRRRGKQVLPVSEYYRTSADLCNAVTTYYRTVRFKLDIFKFAHRKATALCTN